ncbi:hypothetical protein A2W43_01075 [Candidatus Nomurabacteria bacterium RIFCSPHIGHO2_12_40_11]|nr:MAG: hypothetical protein A2W43_01075 [Candidatus Nomurabacteria bacterium RIFCSPHIGHO2_12_40_11]
MKNIFITGGCGYVGSRLALTLDKPGYQVHIIDIVSPGERNIKFPSHFKVTTGDLRNKDCVKNSLDGIDLVIHLAADVGPIGYMHEYQAEILANNMSIDSLLYPEAVRAGVKTIVYSSSSMVYQHANGYPYKESQLNQISPPSNVYGLSKLVGEYFCRSFHDQYGLNSAVIRYHNIYGPGEDSKGSTPADIHVIPALIEKVLRGQYPLELLGKPEATRPFTYIDDAVEATKMVVEKAIEGDTQVLNNDFDIGPKEATRIIDLAQLIWKLLGDGRKFEYIVKETKFDTSIRREMDPTKIETLLGWKPNIKLEDGILKTAEWIKNLGKVTKS